MTPVVVMAMSEPVRRSMTDGSTALVTRNVPVRLTRRQRSHRLSGVSRVVPIHSVPALATRMSMGPSVSVVRATASATEDSSDTSQTTGRALPPPAVMVSATEWTVPGSLPGSSVRAATATAAPAGRGPTRCPDRCRDWRRRRTPPGCRASPGPPRPSISLVRRALVGPRILALRRRARKP